MKCNICEIGCAVNPGQTGRCGMMINSGDSMAERFPEQYLSVTPVSIETVPMTHYRPRAKFLQVSGIGCNLTCTGCVSELFTRDSEAFAQALKHYSPEELVAEALGHYCDGIVWCMNEPTVCHYTFRELAEAAHRAGLAVGCSTNAFHTAETLSELVPYLDFVNCGLKASSDQAYRVCGAPGAGPVFRNLRMLIEHGVHVEISMMYARGQEFEVLDAARKVADIDKNIPFQVMRFVPFGNAPKNLQPTVEEAENLCQDLKEILSFVYLFNSPGTSFLDIICPNCGAPLFHREFFGPMGCRTLACPPDGVCGCGHRPLITGPIHPEPFAELGMSGGYRFTRALEIINSICGCLGLNTDDDHRRIWRDVLQHDDVLALHEKIHRIDTYLELIESLGRRLGRTPEADALIAFMKERVDAIAEGTRNRHLPRVFYAMCTPFFALHADRFEVHMAEMAGGRCVNRQLARSGKPGVDISVEELLYFNPEHIFVSGLFSVPEDDFYAICQKKGVWIDAVNDRRIHTVPQGCSFGHPRWILGLMYMANILHPERFDFDFNAESRLFDQKFGDSTPATDIASRQALAPTAAVSLH